MSDVDNNNLGVCGLCGRDPQALEREIERLREQLNDSVSHETLMATECDRDDAREAARHLWDEWIDEFVKDGDGGAIYQRWPWLEVSNE